MRRAVAAGFLLTLLCFLLPLVAVRQDLPENSQSGQEESESGEGTVQEDSSRTVRVQVDDQVVTMGLEDYIWRVVAAEMPATFEVEALKAQAVAARTYTLRRCEASAAAGQDVDVSDDPQTCQAYITPEEAAANWGENAAAYTQKITDAVQSTKGQVLLYDGQLISAVFFSSAPGRTSDAEAVWGNSVPYLQGVESPEGDEVPNYHTAVAYTPDQFRTLFLAAHPEANLDGSPTGWFGIPVYSSGDTVSSISVGGVSVAGTELRNLCALRSASFTVTAKEDGIVFDVTGSGHGVGMSQYGANALAEQGKTYVEILKWYYTDVELGTWE